MFRTCMIITHIDEIMHDIQNALYDWSNDEVIHDVQNAVYNCSKGEIMHDVQNAVYDWSNDRSYCTDCCL